jgi:hypothetical protein
MYWLWLLILVPISFFALKAWRSARSDAVLLIDSILKNSLQNLGYKPDAASLMFLATHPFLSAKIWKVLGDGGATGRIGSPVSEDTELSCDQLLRYVNDRSFRNDYPCAGALIQYAIYICDRSPELQRYGCRHPKDELEQKETA